MLKPSTNYQNAMAYIIGPESPFDPWDLESACRTCRLAYANKELKQVAMAEEHLIKVMKRYHLL